MLYKTPIMKCKIELKNINVFVKREDLLPFSFGGNKVRIAQEFYADMDAQGKDVMIGYGNARSNLSRALANINFFRGGVCHIITPADDDGTRVETNNSYMVHACGVTFHECLKQNVSDTVENVITQCVKSDLMPYYIYGNKYGEGNEAVPVRAYAKVYEEILSQEKEMGVRFDYIFLATGTGMTQSGLLAGQIKEKRLNQQIIGVSVARNKEKIQSAITRHVNAYFAEEVSNIYGKINVLDEYVGGGYGKCTQGIVDTIQYMFKNNGIPLDPVYTGKAFWGMTGWLKEQKVNGSNVLFIHTGGTPLFFDNIKLLQRSNS